MHPIFIASLVSLCLVVTMLMGYPLFMLRLIFMPLFEWVFRCTGRNPMHWCFDLWLRTMRRLCYDSLNVSWRYTGNHIFGAATEKNRSKLCSPGLKIVVVNHPCNYFTIVPLLGTTLTIGPWLIALLKHSHFLGPHGAGLWGVHGGVFVNRLFQMSWLRHFPALRDRLRRWSFNLLHHQLEKLAKAAAKAKAPVTLVVFSDERWTKKRWNAKVEDNYYPGITKDKVFVMKAKSGALAAVFAACGGLDVEIIDMTICVDRHPAEIEGWLAFGALARADILIDSQVVTEEVLALAANGDITQIDRAVLQAWLYDRQIRKNVMYGRHLWRNRA